MEQPTELTKTVNELLSRGYRCQLLTSDYAVLARQRPIGETIQVVTVSADGRADAKPLSQFLEEILNE